MSFLVKTGVIKIEPVIDSVRALGQWVIGPTGESPVEPYEPVYIKIYKKFNTTMYI